MKTLFQFSLLIATFTAAWIVTLPKALADQRTVRQTEALFESFEKSPSGPVNDLKTTVGRWDAESGQAVIDDQHAHQGKQCLRLTGGEKNSVILHVASEADTSGVLSFQAERWTKRGPFSFRIEKRSGDRWKQIFDGDDSIIVGRAFLSNVQIPLNDPLITHLRFTISSPGNTGLLMDDVRIAPVRKQEITSIDVLPVRFPALKGAERSPLIRIDIQTEGTEEPLELTQIQAAIQGHAGDIASVSTWFHAPRNSDSRTRGPVVTSFGQVRPWDGVAVSNSKPEVQRMEWQTSGRMLLREGINTVWVGCQISETANIDRELSAETIQLQFSDGSAKQLQPVQQQTITHRLGLALKQQGEAGVHTYRIPGLATTNKGSLIAVYDVRHRSGGDLPGDIDVGMSRSTDGGHQWEPIKIIMDQGEDPRWRFDGIGDPAVLVDRNTGTIWVAATWSHGNRSWHGSGPGTEPNETGQLILVRSDDDGATWSSPINITKTVKPPEWSFLLQGPGKGITMQDGTLVFAAQYQDPPSPDAPAKHRLPHSTILFSQDHGETWKVGTGAFDDTTEAQVVELEPGRLMLNCRYNRKSSRVIMVSDDLGQTWQPHSTSQRSLIEPRACMASLIDVNRELGQKNAGLLLFSNPNSLSGRNHITIKASSDHGMTWPESHHVLLDEGTGAGYSCMTMIDENTIGILYEGSQAQMTFQRISLSAVVGHQNDRK